MKHEILTLLEQHPPLRDSMEATIIDKIAKSREYLNDMTL